MSLEILIKMAWVMAAELICVVVEVDLKRIAGRGGTPNSKTWE